MNAEIHTSDAKKNQLSNRTLKKLVSQFFLKLHLLKGHYKITEEFLYQIDFTFQ